MVLHLPYYIQNGGLCGFISANYRIQPTYQFIQIGFYNAPNDFIVNTKIVMYNPITKSSNSFPFNLRIAISEVCVYTIAKTDLLILDDFGLTHLEQQQQLDMMEMIEDRHGKSSTIIASQLPVANWYDVIGEETFADAILDRIVHTSYRIELKGESLRKKR